MAERLPRRPAATPPLRPTDIRTHPIGTALGRLYFAGGPHPSAWNTFRYFGPVPTMRFDHHPPPARDHPALSISYAAPSRSRRNRRLDPLVAAVRETFAPSGIIDVTTGAPWFCLWSPSRALRLLDVVDGPWVARVGGNAAIASGARRTARAWSRDIHAAYADVDGIYYQTSSTPQMRSAALYERARPALPAAPELDLPLSHPGLRAALRRIADDYDMYLVVT